MAVPGPGVVAARLVGCCGSEEGEHGVLLCRHARMPGDAVIAHFGLVLLIVVNVKRQEVFYSVSIIHN